MFFHLHEKLGLVLDTRKHQPNLYFLFKQLNRHCHKIINTDSPHLPVQVPAGGFKGDGGRGDVAPIACVSARRALVLSATQLC